MYRDRIIIIYYIAFVIIITIILYFIFSSYDNGTREHPEFIVYTLNNNYNSNIMFIVCTNSSFA